MDSDGKKDCGGDCVLVFLIERCLGYNIMELLHFS